MAALRLRDNVSPGIQTQEAAGRYVQTQMPALSLISMFQKLRYVTV